MSDATVGLPLVELAKLGAAGVSVLVLALAFWLLHQREAAAARSVPARQRIPIPDSKPIYALMVLGFISSLVLVLATIFTPKDKIDLFHEIKTLEGLSRSLRDETNVSIAINKGVNDFLNDPSNRSPLHAVQGKFKTFTSNLSYANSQAQALADQLRAKSSTIPPQPEPLPPLENR